MAVNVKSAAAGNGPPTGMQKTPAPTRKAPPDAVSQIRNPTPQSYGENGPHNNASRTNPGEFAESDLAANLRESVDDDGALARIVREGTANQDDSVTGQLRTIAKGNVPDHPAMKSPNKVGAGTYDFDSLPAKLGETQAPDPTDPNA